MTDTTPSPKRRWPIPLAIAIVAFAAVVLTLDSNGAVPQLGEGPGLTLDETFNVQMGVYHVRAIREYGVALLHPDSVKEVFGNPSYNPDHPPLGRLVISLAHELTYSTLQPDVADDNVCVTCVREGGADSSALTVFLVGWTASRWYGRSAGVVAAIGMILMPRLFAHAHIASLETFVNLTYLATLVWIAERWRGERRPPWPAVIIGGILFGLCLLTKIQAVLLPIPIGLWAVWRWRLRAIMPMILFGATGLAVFFISWPWLWLDPVNHLQEYFGRSTNRLTLYCWYLDHKWADTDVPWHYSFAMFAVTVPVGLHFFGVIGAFQLRKAGQNNSLTAFLLLNVIWPLVFFAIPGITVYDGVRLFLMSFPCWAILIGHGASVTLEWLTRKTSQAVATSVVAVVLLAQGYGVWNLHPLQLSYYNAFTGGLPGAKSAGFEANYWGDAVTQSFIEEFTEQFPEGSTLYVAPVLHPFQLGELMSQSPSLRDRNIILRAYDDQSGEDMRYVLVFRRRADSWASLTPAPDGRLIAEIKRQGVQLAAVYELN